MMKNFNNKNVTKMFAINAHKIANLFRRALPFVLFSLEKAENSNLVNYNIETETYTVIWAIQ